MSKIKRLLKSYNDYISVPWRDDAAAAQRVIFCVYSETEERSLRVKIDEFELTDTRKAEKLRLMDEVAQRQQGEKCLTTENQQS